MRDTIQDVHNVNDDYFVCGRKNDVGDILFISSTIDFDIQTNEEVSALGSYSGS